MTAPSDESGASGRAERSGMELRVTQSRLGDTIQRGRRNDAAEGARDSVALVVGHHEEDVGCALWRYDSRRPVWLRIQIAFLDRAAERQRWGRELFPVKRDGCAG